jgi:hypothetical protein
LFKLFRLFWWMGVQPLLWWLFDFNILKWNPVSSPVTIWFRNSSPSSWYYSKKKSKPKPFSAFCVHPWTFLEPILCKTCDSLA